MPGEWLDGTKTAAGPLCVEIDFVRQGPVPLWVAPGLSVIRAAGGRGRNVAGLLTASLGGGSWPKSGCPGAKVGGTTVIICFADQIPCRSLPGK
jgi:hypothetical protein